jgi:hypothetical protein
MQKDGHFDTRHGPFWEKKFSPLLRPQSADRKTSDGVQRAETHFFAQVIFWNIIILGISTVYSSGPFFSYLTYWRWLLYVSHFKGVASATSLLNGLLDGPSGYSTLSELCCQLFELCCQKVRSLHTVNRWDRSQ